MLAKTVNLSESRFRHLFKQEMGISLSSFRRRQQLSQAHDLLLTTFLSVKEILAKVRAADQSHFNRYFKEGIRNAARYLQKEASAFRNGNDRFRQQLAESANESRLTTAICITNLRCRGDDEKDP